MAKKIVKASSHGEHTGRPSVNALAAKVTAAIQEHPQFDLDQHGQPEGSPGDVEPYCFDVTTPDETGKMHAIIRRDDGKCVKHAFTYDGKEIKLDEGPSEETECTQVYAQAEESYKKFVKAAGSADGAKKGHAARKTDTATAASQAAHEASATAHDSGEDDDHNAAKAAHEAASEAHKGAMIAHAKAGNSEQASDHAKAMAAHDACADAHCRKDSDAVKAASTEYVGKFVKAGGPGSGRHAENSGDESADKASTKAYSLSEKANDSGKREDHINARMAHDAANNAHLDASEKEIKNKAPGYATRARDHVNQAFNHRMDSSDHLQSEHRIVEAGIAHAAKASDPESPVGIVHCEAASVEFPEDELPTSEFMWMPAGTHTIRASYDDKLAVLTVDVNPAKTAGVVKASFQRILERSANRPPFGCVQHKEGEATFWPKDFTAHDDGVYCQAEWTELGLKCVRGKTFRSFSPSFSCDAEWVKAVDNGSGVLVFPDGARGSSSNPARVTGVSPKSVGSLTNWPAFKEILPVKAEEPTGKQADPQPATTKPAEQQQEQQNMKIKFIKASSDGKHAAGIVAELAPDQAQPYVTAGEAASPEIADIVIGRQAEQARQAETNKGLVKSAIVRAQERGALPKAKEGKEHDDVVKATETYTRYLNNGVPVVDVCDLIDGMPSKTAIGGTGASASLFVRASSSGETRSGLELGNETLAEACDGIVRAYEPMVGKVGAEQGLVRAGRMDEAIAISRQVANKYNEIIRPILNRGGDFALKDMVRAADTSDPNGNLGTIATGILLIRNLGYLKSKLVPMMVATTDLSAEPVKYNQQVITRYLTPPNVLTWVKGVGYTANASDTTRTVSTPSTTDVAINMQQNKAVCIKFDNQLLGSTIRNLFGEQQSMQFYSLAKAINKHWISTVIGSAWTPKTEAGGVLTPPKFNSSGWNIPSLVAVKNKMTLAQIPDEDRQVILHSYFHDILLQDSNLLTAYVIKAALQAQANPNLTNFGNVELPILFGLDVHESQLFSDAPYTDTGWTPTTFGFAGTKASSLFVSRIPNDWTTALPDIPATAAIQVVTEPDSNLSVLFGKWVDNAAKETNAECSLMYQAAQGHPGMGFLLNTIGGVQTPS